MELKIFRAGPSLILIILTMSAWVIRRKASPSICWKEKKNLHVNDFTQLWMYFQLYNNNLKWDLTIHFRYIEMEFVNLKSELNSPLFIAREIFLSDAYQLSPPRLPATSSVSLVCISYSAIRTEVRMAFVKKKKNHHKTLSRIVWAPIQLMPINIYLTVSFNLYQRTKGNRNNLSPKIQKQTRSMLFAVWRRRSV